MTQLSRKVFPRKLFDRYYIDSVALHENMESNYLDIQYVLTIHAEEREKYHRAEFRFIYHTKERAIIAYNQACQIRDKSK